MPGTFYSRFEKALRVSAGPAVIDGRLQGSTPVTVRDLANPAMAAPPVAAQYELFGPGDVQQLAAGAITRRFPAPGASDAEERKTALVEFSALDLPWRYTPAAAAAGPLRPWLVLVVGRRSSDEIVLRPDGRVTLGTLAQSNHILSQSSRWAHVHEIDGKQIARILSPIDLASETGYVACLVPGFAGDGSDAWPAGGGGPVTLDCYDRWQFRTGPEGDFPELAARLHEAELAGLVKPFGRAEVTVTSRRDMTSSTVLATGGALKLPLDPADGPVPAEVAAETTALSERIVTPDGRGVVTAPRYEAPFTDPADADAAPDPGGWIDYLHTDPRARSAAGLGAWTAIAWQDQISNAAATKAGDLAIAHDRIRHLALGVEVSRSLWRRRMPPPSSPVQVLAVLSPVLGRLPATSGGTVLDQITGRTPQFGPALLSSAARRALRPGPARTALAEPTSYATVLAVANDCPKEADDPADIRRRGDGDVDGAIKEAVFAATGGDGELTAQILDRLGGRHDPGQLIALFEAVAPGPDGRPDPQRLDRWLNTREFPQPDVPLSSWPGWMSEAAPPEPCRPVDLTGLATVVAGAVDPTGPRPPAVVRVLATLPGITSIGPVEIEPELDLPLWSFLSQNSPDWMLPGAGDLKEDEVVGLSTNPAFVQALLAGANRQATGELRWRNIPMTSRWSPLRKFWQRPAAEYDITPVKGWPGGEPLGSTVLSGGRGAEAVVAFRTSLFRRYPATVVYLYATTPAFTTPAELAVLATPQRVDPAFTGTIGTDITFFGFPVSPDALKTHWVVLEEPPAGYRFYSTDETPPPWPGKPDTDSAGYAYNRFATPVRVLIGPLLQ